MWEYAEIFELVNQWEERLLRYAGRFAVEGETPDRAVENAFLRLIRSGKTETPAEVRLFQFVREELLTSLPGDRGQVPFLFSREPELECNPIRKGICFLPGRLQEVLVLFFEFGFPYGGISAIIGKDKESVCMALQEAEETLKKNGRIQQERNGVR